MKKLFKHVLFFLPAIICAVIVFVTNDFKTIQESTFLSIVLILSGISVFSNVVSVLLKVIYNYKKGKLINSIRIITNGVSYVVFSLLWPVALFLVFVVVLSALGMPLAIGPR